MSKTHLIADESLGGVLREYVEVERKADVGDYVYFSDDVDTPEYLKVTGYDHKIDYLEVEHNPEEWGATVSVSWEACRTLEPTDIVHIDGQRYRMVDREAKVGERIIIVNGYSWYRDKVGYIYDVIHPSKYNFEGNDNNKEAYVEHEKNAYDDVIHFVRRGNYRVLEPVESTEIVTPEESDDKSVLDLLANLLRRVAELERKLGEYARKIDGIEADIQNINVDLGDGKEKRLNGTRRHC